MKFLSLAIAALVGMTEGKKTLSAQQLKTRMSKGQFSKHTLMRGAKPYGEAARRLEEGDDGDWAINGLYSVQFSSCVSMTVQDEDLFDENYIEYAQDGEIVAEKSYILFTACKSSDCYYQEDNEKMTFITDIASFFQAFADFLPNQVENYCEGCNNNYDYCMGNLDAQQENYDANGDDGNGADDQDAGDDGQEQDNENEDEQDDADQDGQQNDGDNDEGRRRRKLSEIFELPSRRLANDQVVQMIDCDMCEAYECFEDEEEEQGDDDAVVYEFEDALDWLDGLSQCQQMEDGYYNNMALYAGLICNDDGTGVEIGVFMDEYCTLYAPKLSFGNMMSYADKEYFSMSEEVVEYMFTNDFSCYQPEIQYTNPYEYEEQDDEDNNGDDDAYPEAAEWCENLYNGNMEAINLYDCGVNQNDDQNDDQNQEYDDYLDSYGWYSYQLSQNDLQDGSSVCQAVKAFDGEYSTVYDKTNGGTLYNYKKNWGNKNSSKSGMRPGGVATLVILIILVAAAVAAFVVKSKKPSDKRTPLINNNEGTMA